MMQLLAQLLGQQSSGGGSGSYVCTVSGAGTTTVNGNYYVDPNDAGQSVGKQENADYWIKEVMDYPGYGDVYILCDMGGIIGEIYYFWLHSEGLNPSTIHIGPNGSSPVPTIHT